MTSCFAKALFMVLNISLIIGFFRFIGWLIDLRQNYLNCKFNKIRHEKEKLIVNSCNYCGAPYSGATCNYCGRINQ